MKQQVVFRLACLSGLLLLLNGCAVPRTLWPQEDLPSSELTGKPGAPTVLLASRNSEFKRALVRELSQALASVGVSQRTIGVGDLNQISLDPYNAVVVISPCIAWGLERDVQVFLERQQKNSKIILVATSGDGGWLPDNRVHDVDAISSASVLTTVEAVARDVMIQISRHLP